MCVYNKGYISIQMRNVTETIMFTQHKFNKQKKSYFQLEFSILILNIYINKNETDPQRFSNTAADMNYSNYFFNSFQVVRHFLVTVTSDIFIYNETTV